MKSFTSGMSGVEKERARIVKSHEIAKIVCEAASTYAEAVDLLNRAKRELEEAALSVEPQVRDKPRDGWGDIIKTPEMAVPGAEL